MSRDGCVALPHGAMGLSAVSLFVIVVFPDHTHYFCRVPRPNYGLKNFKMAAMAPISNIRTE